MLGHSSERKLLAHHVWGRSAIQLQSLMLQNGEPTGQKRLVTIIPETHPFMAQPHARL